MKNKRHDKPKCRRVKSACARGGFQARSGIGNIRRLVAAAVARSAIPRARVKVR